LHNTNEEPSLLSLISVLNGRTCAVVVGLVNILNVVFDDALDAMISKLDY